MSSTTQPYVAVWPQGLPDRVRVTRKGWRQLLLEWWVALTTLRPACAVWPIDPRKDDLPVIARNIERKFFR